MQFDLPENTIPQGTCSSEKVQEDSLTAAALVSDMISLTHGLSFSHIQEEKRRVFLLNHERIIFVLLSMIARELWER